MDYKLKELFINDSFLQESFNLLYGKKIQSSCYVDLTLYVSLSRTKADFLSQLQSSFLARFFEKPYPTAYNVDSEWAKVKALLEEQKDELGHYPLSIFEREALFYWIFSSVKKQDGRIFVLRYIIKQVSGWADVDEKEGIFFDPEKIRLHLTSSFSKIISLIPSSHAFFRGHELVNYQLQPSVFRTDKLRENEHKLVNHIQIECPEDFVDCQSWFERLVKMQHYGLPTRLLDVTTNPLVALYFACSSNPSSIGELVLLYKDEALIRYPQSDEVSILSNLATLDSDQKFNLYQRIRGMAIRKDDALECLLSGVQAERRHVKKIEKHVLLSDYFVYALKKNKRIAMQDGAFVLCGLDAGMMLEQLRFKRRLKKDIILVKGKEEILKNLDLYGINKATLFPEIDNVAEYLKEKYNK